ncbi:MULTISPECIES: hypothetical protein [unclassified Microcoleus]|uniref:hypothetical protein n=1 Tax=unclassified Microcoleus TaxID=2642155 RepID=UPI001D6878F9|nr:MULTISPECIES: hypothetical protein [unclassified Microcoleus]MCC3475854.1 hypothetical protein [Microcoleus sp. PH2017_13_LAR_U_A]MCC3488376.1 hypothetical protein [Microcoleus sp. PH2017_14_LAR_D_A]MCC3593481.1 hypothetical protein [Microcoleus sp. PH2017_28_MFU_U_A]MCC3600944.1 hypothetical protein [Microcoleus sp. PH2017_26_ELK_O_A]MCC3626121.1 hypothetical protein [Microcoleus sp. PH2017_36_ELK_O_B]
MKRLMQAMLAVALVLVTAFTFYVDTASAQPVSAPVPATTSSPTTPISRDQVCTIPPSGSCVLQMFGGAFNARVENLGSDPANVMFIAEGEIYQSLIIPGNSVVEYANHINGGNEINEITIYNKSSSSTVKISLR